MASLELKPTLLRQASPLADPAVQRARLEAVELTDELDGDFDRHTARAGLHPLTATGVEVLQVNVGKVCNQTCAHCHVDAGPERRESMTAATAQRCLDLLAVTDIPTLDITGGAPELNPSFRRLVSGARELGRHVIDRCNLTILDTGPGADLPRFLADNRVEVVCSLPHYRRVSTDRQRGKGVFEASIDGLRKLNAVGYGREPDLRLVLVTNPVGAFLPAGQGSLEAEWKRELKRLHDVDFDALFTITNMPISRYLQWLERSGNLEAYLQRLVDAFNPTAVAGVMCRTTLSVGWDGRLFDCDFNQMLELTVAHGTPQHIDDLDPAGDSLVRLRERRIVTGRHCFGCTAGAGSSCGGALEG
ncbi:radical SAM/Cys-rich domain protein [Engelhardtia mirabilis]|uniref:Cyclic pyranopterin monophosphate synthase n=1 Tax=Engelhardtia mirabilis TaxID=2528011 RepID=A0A518BP96_9BACT|nr:Cyclic pyranopterin monophosphate synthase [Planctomycetes bacterium Pla133]QDV03080.1 Cyclic pyranopterin monophosphate synthase [Planctomycetes bacterium Pla86]